MRSFLRGPIVLLAGFTLVMLVVFTVTSFMHGGASGPPPTPYNFQVQNVTITPAAP